MASAEAADGITIDETNFPSSLVRGTVSSADRAGNGDGILDAQEAKTVTSLQCYYNKLKSLKGVVFFGGRHYILPVEKCCI